SRVLRSRTDSIATSSKKLCRSEDRRRVQLVQWQRPQREESAMPLLDHFNPPLSRTHPWRSFHGAWAAAIARLLNQGVLPSGYYAVPLMDRDGLIEIDVAALREHETPVREGGTVAAQTWAAPAPGLAVAVELPAAD